MDVANDLERVSVGWRAEEHAVEAKLQAKVDALEGRDSDGATPEGTPTAASSAAQDADSQIDDQSAAVLGWTVIDVAVVRFAGPQYKLTEDEIGRLAKASVPVLKKYFPDGFGLSPEAALLVVAGSVYGPKVLAAPPSPPKPEATPA